MEKTKKSKRKIKKSIKIAFFALIAIMFLVLVEIIISRSLANSKSDKTDERVDYADGFEMLGKNIEEVEEVLGETKVVGDYTRFFPIYGITLEFDGNNKLITKVTNAVNEDSRFQMPIFGILPGNDIDEAIRKLENKGIEVTLEDGELKSLFQINGDDKVIYEIEALTDDSERVISINASIHI